MLDWRISLGVFVILITAFALIWPLVSTDWELEFRSAYESVRDDDPIIDDVFNVYLDEDRNLLIYVKEECDVEDIQPGYLLHVTPANTGDLERSGSTFNNYDFDFDAHGLRFDNNCVIQFNLPDYDYTRIRTGQYLREGDEFHNLWIQEAIISPE